MKIVILDAITLGDDIDLSIFKEFGELDIYQTTSQDEVNERIKDADIIITNKVIINKDTMKKALKLKLICIAATGMNNVDLNAAKEMNIVVKNVAGYSTESVVQHTFSMLFYLLERVKYYDEFVKSGKWSQSGIFTHIGKGFNEIANKEWGIIGLGTIGKRVASVASSFGAKVSYYSTNGKAHSDIYPHKELKELLSSSDIISIHAPLNEKTLNLIGKDELSMIKNRAILLNLGRGGIIDEEALANEMDKRELYVGLDVLAKEPIDIDNPLMKIKNRDNLLITPHIAWTSKEARERLIKGIVKNIKEFMEKE